MCFARISKHEHASYAKLVSRYQHCCFRHHQNSLNDPTLPILLCAAIAQLILEGGAWIPESDSCWLKVTMLTQIIHARHFQ